MINYYSGKSKSVVEIYSSPSNARCQTASRDFAYLFFFEGNFSLITEWSGVGTSAFGLVCCAVSWHEPRRAAPKIAAPLAQIRAQPEQLEARSVQRHCSPASLGSSALLL